MPWSVKNPPRPAKNWSQSEKKKCVKAANAVLRESGTEQDAIFACIRAAGKTKHPGGKKEASVTESFKVQANVSLMDRLKSFLAMVQFNTRIGHSSMIGMYQDGDGFDTLEVSSPDVEDFLPEGAAIGDVEYGVDGKLKARFFKEGITQAVLENPYLPDDYLLPSNLYIFKDEEGLYHGVGIVSNNRLDRQEDIITTEGHETFVKALDDGTYKRLMGKDMPEIWLWHLPVAIGDATMVAYDERGFLITAWKQRPDEFSTKAHQVLEGIIDTLGMSHSFPAILTSFDTKNLHHITGYYSREFTLLPLKKAANWLTGAAAIMFKELEEMMKIPDYKREWFVNDFGEEFVAQLDERLDLLDQAANAVGLPKKELQMPEDLEGQEAVEEVEAADAEVTEEVVEETETDVEGAAETEESEEETDETEEEVVEEPQTGMTPTEFFLPKEQLAEIVSGVKEPFDILLKQLQDMNGHIVALAERVELIEKDESEKLAKKAADTPVASLGTQIAQSVIGQSMAQLDYNKDRALHTSGPDEVAEGPDEIEPLGIGYLDDQRRKQRGRKRVIPGTVFNQQQEGV